MSRPAHLEGAELPAIQAKAIETAVRLEKVPLDCATVELNSFDAVALAFHHGLVCGALQMLQLDRDVVKIVDEAPAGSLAPIAVALGLDQDARLEEVYRKIRDIRTALQAREGRVVDIDVMSFALGIPDGSGFERQLEAAQSLRESAKPPGPKIRKLQAKVAEMKKAQLREEACKLREAAGMCPCGECRLCVENLGSEIDGLRVKMKEYKAL